MTCRMTTKMTLNEQNDHLDNYIQNYLKYDPQNGPLGIARNDIFVGTLLAKAMINQ